MGKRQGDATQPIVSKRQYPFVHYSQPLRYPAMVEQRKCGTFGPYGFAVE